MKRYVWTARTPAGEWGVFYLPAGQIEPRVAYVAKRRRWARRWRRGWVAALDARADAETGVR